MKENSFGFKKRSILFLAVLLLAVLLFPKNVFAQDVYAGAYTADEIQTICQRYMEQIIQMDDAELEELAAQASLYGEELDFVADYAGIKDAAGAFVGFSDFTISETDGVVSAVQTVEFQNGKYDLNFHYDYINNVVRNTLTPAEASGGSFGAKMSKAAMNTVMGLFTVFLVLVVMIIVISLFKFIAPQEKKEEAKAADSFEAQVQQREAVTSAVNDTELVAVIAAAIAAATGQTTDSFVVRSIKRR